MGLFNRYMKEGPGVAKDAPQKHAFVVFFEIFFRKFWKLINLNLIYFLFCLPIVTIGPATAGFTYVLRNFSREQHSFVWMDFIDAFRANWKQSLVVSIVDAIVIYLSVINFGFYQSMSNGENSILGYIMLGAFLIILILYLFMHYYIYMVLVTFDLKLKDVYRNAFILGVLGIPRNMLITVICGAILATFLLPTVWLISVGLTPLILLSLLGFITCFIAYPVMNKFLLQPSLRQAKGLDPFGNPEDDEPEPEEEKSELQRIFTDTIPSQNPDLRDWNKRKTKDEK